MPEQTNGDGPGSLTEAFDSVPSCLAFFSVDGALLFANRHVRHLWNNESDGNRIKAEVLAFASRLRDHINGANGEILPAGETPVSIVVDTGHRALRLLGSHIRLDLFGRGGTILVAVQSTEPQGLSDSTLSQRYGLTAREIRVARMLAAGKSNADVAGELFISPHTARTHTERVLRKVGARSRAEVGSILRGG